MDLDYNNRCNLFNDFILLSKRGYKLKARSQKVLSMTCTCCNETSKNTDTDMICYCNSITKQEIELSIKETGYSTISEIKHHLRDELVSDCVELNPSGKCCHQSFNEVIQQVLDNLRAHN